MSQGSRGVRWCQWCCAGGGHVSPRARPCLHWPGAQTPLGSCGQVGTPASPCLPHLQQLFCLGAGQFCFLTVQPLTPRGVGLWLPLVQAGASGLGQVQVMWKVAFDDPAAGWAAKARVPVCPDQLRCPPHMSLPWAASQTELLPASLAAVLPNLVVGPSPGDECPLCGPTCLCALVSPMCGLCCPPCRHACMPPGPSGGLFDPVGS